MISLQGNLTVREINGRNGAFRVGRLLSELGEFAVKSQLIEQFDPGNYRGSFAVTRIFPASYVSGGRVTCEVRAELFSVALDDIDPVPPKMEPHAEPDPLDEERSAQALHVTTPSIALSVQAPTREGAVVDATTSTPEPSPEDDVVQRLFGNLWPLQEVVKLDPTVGRADLRLQIEHLKALGYRYDAQVQQWSMPLGQPA